MSNKKQIYGITYLKAILPFLVIACHARPFGPSAAMSISLQNVPDWKDIFYVNILTLAVPLFFLMSFYLYLNKRERVSYSTKKLMYERCRYFLGLFIIWRIVYAIAGIGQFWNAPRGGVRNLYHLLFAGGDTLLYYLEQMVYLTIVLEVLCLLLEKRNLNKEKCSLCLFMLSTAILCCSYLCPETLRVEALRYFSPIGFLPYLFLAMYLHQRKKPILMPVNWVIMGTGFLVALLEWRFAVDAIYLECGYAMAIPSYQRLSVVMLAGAIFAGSLNIDIAPGRIVRCLSSLSLYIYCVHQIVIKLVGQLANHALVNYVLVVGVAYAFSILAYYIKSVISKEK